MINSIQFKTAGLGEVLWDVFPDGEKFGGAPGNCACHCRALGAESYVISCVGNDELGKKAEEFLLSHKVNISGLSVSDKFPTGTVPVLLDENGKPEYEIKEGVAWDNIPFTGNMAKIASHLDAVCFGSLAQRNEASRLTIKKFLKATRFDCLRMFDINIRLNFYTDQIIKSSLELANGLKLNDEELPLLAELFNISGSIEEQLQTIVKRFNLQIAILTCGPEGALMVKGEEIDFCPCSEVEQIVSTVGAGDSFTAAAIMGYLQNLPLAEINKRANMIASYVCTQVGAVPQLPDELI